MLVLTRKLGESIDIDDTTITITLIEIRAGQVKLGVVAPANVSVHRAEVARRIREAGEDPRVRLVKKPALPPTTGKRRRGPWDRANQQLTAEALRIRREDEAVADAEERRERAAAAKGGAL